MVTGPTKKRSNACRVHETENGKLATDITKNARQGKTADQNEPPQATALSEGKRSGRNGSPDREEKETIPTDVISE